jgi:hypothetical protein
MIILALALFFIVGMILILVAVNYTENTKKQMICIDCDDHDLELEVRKILQQEAIPFTAMA